MWNAVLPGKFVGDACGRARRRGRGAGRCAPSARQRRAIASPMPVVLPVTMMTLSVESHGRLTTETREDAEAMTEVKTSQ